MKMGMRQEVGKKYLLEDGLERFVCHTAVWWGLQSACITLQI
jgi:hypothetical protein